MNSIVEPGLDKRNVKLWDDTRHEHDMMSTRMLGFWLYMLSDSLIFAALFAAYEVLSYDTSFAGGPTPHEVASPIRAYVETVVLFTSVLTYGFGMVELRRDRPRGVIAWIAVSFLVGVGFIGMEWQELAGLVHIGATPQRSGYLSIFFTLIGVHAIHIAFGLLWMLVLMAQVKRGGLNQMVTYRLANLKIFWLYQTLIWTFVFTFVYLRGSL